MLTTWLSFWFPCFPWPETNLQITSCMTFWICFQGLWLKILLKEEVKANEETSKQGTPVQQQFLLPNNTVMSKYKQFPTKHGRRGSQRWRYKSSRMFCTLLGQTVVEQRTTPSTTKSIKKRNGKMSRANQEPCEGRSCQTPLSYLLIHVKWQWRYKTLIVTTKVSPLGNQGKKEN